MASTDPHSIADHALLFELKRGDERALHIIYERYWYGLYNKALHLLGEEEVCKDIVQELFISLWDKRPEREIDNLKAYLYQALKYRCFIELRQRYATEKHYDHLAYLLQQKQASATSEHPDNLVNIGDAEEKIRQVLQTLPARCREVFVLSRFEQLSSREIANRMDISIKTVVNQKTKAIAIMRKALKDFLVLSMFIDLLT